MREVTLESEEWYVLCNWLRERENRVMYALRSKSDEWEFVTDLRRTIERRDDAPDTPDTRGTTRTVELSDRQVEYLCSYLRRRALKLRLFPWRDRECRDVRHLRDHLRKEANCEG